jgi:hypothetical protein
MFWALEIPFKTGFTVFLSSDGNKPLGMSAANVPLDQPRRIDKRN